MTRMQWLGIACGIFAIGCWLVTVSMRRWIRFHRVHRDSVYFPLTHFEFFSLAGPIQFWPSPQGWCTDCGRQTEKVGHLPECPRVTGERCPSCDRPKRTAHACHYCGFAGFVIMFDLKTPSPVRSSSSLEDL